MKKNVQRQQILCSPFFVVVLVLLYGCTPRPGDDHSSSDSTNLSAMDSGKTSLNDTLKPVRPISDVLAAHTPGWMKISGVQGTGETQKNGQPAIMIFVDSLTQQLSAALPKEVEGYPVVIRESGTVHARAH